MLNWASDPYGLVFSITVSWGSLIFCIGHSIHIKTVTLALAFGRFDSFPACWTEIEQCMVHVALSKWAFNQFKPVLQKENRH